MSFLARYSIFLFFWLAQGQGLWCQQGTIWRLDPNAGLGAAFFNPAATLSSPYNWELNILQVGGFFMNDYVHVEQASALRLLQSYRTGSSLDAEIQTNTWQVGPDRYRFDYNTNTKGHFGRGQLDVLGPGLSLRLGQHTQIGLVSRLRALASARAIDAEFSFYPYNALPFGSPVRLDATFGAAAIWTEVNLQIGQRFYTGSDGEIRLGASFKLLSPIDAVKAYTAGGSLVTKLDSNSLQLSQPVYDIGFTNGLRGTPDEGSSAGRGFAFDLGMQYAWESLEDGTYRFLLGFALLDMGRLQINRTAELHRFSSSEQVLLLGDNYNFNGQEDLDAALEQLNRDFFGGGSLSLIDRQFFLPLPSTFSVQFAFQPIQGLQLTAAHIGDIPLNKQQFTLGQHSTLAAHFSRWWLGAGLSANLYNFRYFNLGGQFRLGPLFFGSDRLLGSLLKHPRLQGGDFVLGLRLHSFQAKGRKSNSSSLRTRGRGGKAVKCYTF